MTGPDERRREPALAAAVLEIERHAAAAGWDQPARLFALVETAELVAREPQLAASLGDEALTADRAGGPGARSVARGRSWPRSAGPRRSHGCAALVERFVLPPDVEAELPDDAGLGRGVRPEHPDRQEVRIVAAATRAGASYCALRLRAHDEDTSVLTGADLVPGAARPGARHARGGDPHERPAGAGVRRLPAAPRAAGRRILLFVVRRRDRRDLPGHDVRLALHRPALVLARSATPGVFDTMLWTRIGLFVGFGLLMGGAVAAQHGHRLPRATVPPARLARSRPASTATATPSRRSARCCWSRWPA